MMKLIPIRAVAERLGLSYDQIALDPILKTVKKDGRDYILSASLTCFKKNEMRVRRLAARPSKVLRRWSRLKHFPSFRVITCYRKGN